MKKLTAAFLWDATNKSISWMIINHTFSIIFPAEKHEFQHLNFKDFKIKTDHLIRNFYNEIRHAYKQNRDCKVIIEYKIVHQVSHDLQDFYQPSERSDFVRKQFLKYYGALTEVISDLKLSQQLRSRLKRPELDKFKEALRTLNIVKPNRKNTYQYHLWILATHATKSNYQRVLKRLTKNLLEVDKKHSRHAA